MKNFKLTTLFVLIMLLALGVWGFIIEPHFLLDVQVHDVEVPNLGSDWEGEKVALLADLQVGMWWGNTEMINKAVKKTVEAELVITQIASEFYHIRKRYIINGSVPVRI